MISPQNSADFLPDLAARALDRDQLEPQEGEKLPEHMGWCMAHTATFERAQGCPACTLTKLREKQRSREDQDRQELLAKAKQDEIEARFGAAGIPTRYSEYTFDTFPVPTDPTLQFGSGAIDGTRRALATMRSYAIKFPSLAARGVSGLLVGGTGTGKTGLACSVANHVIREHGATVAVLTAYGAVRHQRDTWGRKGKTERQALGDLLDVDLLILDDVGTSVGSDSEMAMLFEVINGRYANRSPTLLSSNLPMDDWFPQGADPGQTTLITTRRPGLRSFLGPRVIDRFHDDGSFVLAMDWPSLRGARQ